MHEITSQTTEAAKAAKWKEYVLKENPNPLFKFLANLFRCDSIPLVSVLDTIFVSPDSMTPVETLNTIL